MRVREYHTLSLRNSCLCVKVNHPFACNKYACARAIIPLRTENAPLPTTIPRPDQRTGGKEVKMNLSVVPYFTAVLSELFARYRCALSVAIDQRERYQHKQQSDLKYDNPHRKIIRCCCAATAAEALSARA